MILRAQLTGDLVMKRSAILTAVAAVLVGGGVMVHAADKPKGPTTKPSTTQPSKPVNKFCAVEGKDHEVDPKVTTTYKGKTIGFCCKDCIDEFNKDPEKYVKKME
jgi:YHS domain-containing protein